MVRCQGCLALDSCIDRRGGPNDPQDTIQFCDSITMQTESKAMMPTYKLPTPSRCLFPRRRKKRRTSALGSQKFLDFPSMLVNMANPERNVIYGDTHIWGKALSPQYIAIRIYLSKANAITLLNLFWVPLSHTVCYFLDQMYIEPELTGGYSVKILNHFHDS